VLDDGVHHYYHHYYYDTNSSITDRSSERNSGSESEIDNAEEFIDAEQQDQESARV
jgi:hypothetical protein